MNDEYSNPFSPPEMVVGEDERDVVRAVGGIYPSGAPISLVMPVTTRIFYSRYALPVIACVIGMAVAVFGTLILAVWMVEEMGPHPYPGFVAAVSMALGFFLVLFCVQAWFVAGFLRYLTGIVRGAGPPFFQAFRGNFRAATGMAIYTLVFGLLLMTMTIIFAYLAFEWWFKYYFKVSIYAANTYHWLEYGMYVLFLVLLALFSPGLWIIVEHRLNPLAAFIWSLRITLRNWFSLLLMLLLLVVMTDGICFLCRDESFFRFAGECFFWLVDGYWHLPVFQLLDLAWLVILPYFFMFYPVFCLAACGELTSGMTNDE